MYTFRDMQLHVLRYIDEGDDADTTLALVKDALNRSHQRLLSSRTWSFLTWYKEETFATVAGTRTYALRAGVGKVLSLYDESGAPFPLMSRREWEAQGVDRIGTQTLPAGAIFGDFWPVAAQPSSEAVTIVSNRSADLTVPSVTFTGIDSTGNLATETLYGDGTNPVTTDTVWRHLISVTKSVEWTGVLTVSTVSQGTILTLGGTLTTAQYAKQYPTLEFIETPASARTYRYTAQRTPALLSADNDIPDTPFPYSEIHIYDALLDLTAYNTELGAKEQRLWQARYDTLWAGLIQSVDESIAGSRPRFVRDLSPRAIARRTTSN